MKILHRIYFGFDGKPDPYQRYLETWSRGLPDFEIRKWDGSNLPLDLNEYTKLAHKEKDHAFLSDFFRWWILARYGGVYLDADIEVIDGQAFSTLVEELSNSPDYDAFIGIDEKSGGWFTAHSMASKPGSELAEFMVETYSNLGNLALWRRKIFYFMAPQMVGLYFTSKGVNVDGMGSFPNLESPRLEARTLVLPYHPCHSKRQRGF